MITNSRIYLDSVNLQPDVWSRFLKSVTGDKKALKRLWFTSTTKTFRNDFSALWNRELGDHHDYLTEMATRSLSVHDDVTLASEVILAWWNKYGIEPDEDDLLITLAFAQEDTNSKREAWSRIKDKVTTKRLQKRRMTYKKKQNRPPKTKSLIEVAVKEKPGSPAQIADRLDMARDTVNKQLQRMKKAGVLQSAHGVYSMAGVTVARSEPPAVPVSISEAKKPISPAQREAIFRTLQFSRAEFDRMFDDPEYDLVEAARMMSWDGKLTPDSQDK